MTAGSILIVDDDAELATALTRLLGRAGWQAARAASGDAALRMLAETAPDVILSDVRMPGMSGLDLLAELAPRTDAPPVVLMTAHGDVPMAVEAMRNGAWDFVEKPFEPGRLLDILTRAAAARRLAAENARLRTRLAEATGLDTVLVGESPAMAALREEVAAIAPTDAAVLILGETGTGKELVAQSLHDASPRARGPFVAINCAALPETMVEAMLFGHARGAFTGATAAHPGHFAEADGGTLLLDELGTLPPAIQPKLLRVLETGEVTPLGAGACAGRRVDLRIVSATNASLPAEVEAGRFRADLFYRLNTVVLTLPPLRERGEDVVMLTDLFLARAAARYGVEPPALAPADIAALMAHDWPGNVRELANLAERAVLANLRRATPLSDLLGGGTAPGREGPSGAASPAAGGDLKTQVEALEASLIGRALAQSGGDMTAVAERLGLARRTLNDKMARYGLKRTDFA